MMCAAALGHDNARLTPKVYIFIRIIQATMSRCLFILSLLLCYFTGHSQVLVDTAVGVNAPTGARDYKEMTHLLCDGLRGDQQKANAIYNWITHNIRYDVEVLKKGTLSREKVDKVFKTRKGVCDGYAKLFTAMCNEAGLKAVTVDGYAKDWIFDNGDQLIIPRHSWSAVLVNAQWQLVEPTWGAGHLAQTQTFWRKLIDKITFRKMRIANDLKFVFKYDTQYFLQEPLKFRLKHLPLDPTWQLADSAMPLAVFEAGDSAILEYNKQHPQLKQNSAELMRIASLEEDSVVYDATERAYAFNGRFTVALAIKQIANVKEDVNKVMSEADPEKGQELWSDVQKHLKAAETHIKEQSKYFPDQYAILKRKNGAKNILAKKKMMVVKVDDKQLAAQCKKYQVACAKKSEGYKKKQQDLKRRVAEANRAQVSEGSDHVTPRPGAAEEMMTITDSLATRAKRIDSLGRDLDARMAAISLKKDSNILLLDTLAHCLKLSDSFLVEEAQCRMGMKDNYDDDVIKWNMLFVSEKYQVADSLHRQYFANYDSIIAMTEARYKIYVTVLDAYKRNMKDIERYAKLSNGDTGIGSRYQQVVSGYGDAIDSCNNELNAANNYVRNNAKLFASLAKLYQRQLKIVDYMWQVEDVRKKLELNTILHNQQLDTRENKQQTTNIKAAIKAIGRTYQQ